MPKRTRSTTSSNAEEVPKSTRVLRSAARTTVASPQRTPRTRRGRARKRSPAEEEATEICQHPESIKGVGDHVESELVLSEEPSQKRARDDCSNEMDEKVVTVVVEEHIEVVEPSITIGRDVSDDVIEHKVSEIATKEEELKNVTELSMSIDHTKTKDEECSSKKVQIETIAEEDIGDVQDTKSGERFPDCTSHKEEEDKLDTKMNKESEDLWVECEKSAAPLEDRWVEMVVKEPPESKNVSRSSEEWAEKESSVVHVRTKCEVSANESKEDDHLVLDSIQVEGIELNYEGDDEPRLVSDVTAVSKDAVCGVESGQKKKKRDSLGSMEDARKKSFRSSEKEEDAKKGDDDEIPFIDRTDTNLHLTTSKLKEMIRTTAFKYDPNNTEFTEKGGEYTWKSLGGIHGKIGGGEEQKSAKKRMQKRESSPLNPPSSQLHVRGLVRPFTIVQLKAELNRFAPMIESDFWIFRCFSTQSAEGAVALI